MGWGWLLYVAMMEGSLLHELSEERSGAGEAVSAPTRNSYNGRVGRATSKAIDRAYIRATTVPVKRVQFVADRKECSLVGYLKRHRCAAEL